MRRKREVSIPSIIGAVVGVTAVLVFCPKTESDELNVLATLTPTLCVEGETRVELTEGIGIEILEGPITLQERTRVCLNIGECTIGGYSVVDGCDPEDPFYQD